MKFFVSLFLLLAVCPNGFARSADGLDTIFFERGEKSIGRVLDSDARTIRLQKVLPPPPNSPPNVPPVLATVTVNRDEVAWIEFAPDPGRDELLRAATVAQLPKLAALWKRHQGWLNLPRSPAGSIGLVYGDLLLRSDDPSMAAQALTLFQEIEKNTWNTDDLMGAKQGRLRAMVATGRAAEAVEEAGELAKLSEDPAVLVEAKFLLAEAADQGLRQLVEENPRWTEDVHVIPERDRLYNEALDLYLFPYLFFGSDVETAARGLWGATEVYRFTGETHRAAELARDLVTIYADTKYASLARKFLDGLPPEIRKQDNEKEARQDAAPSDEK